jgi:hypothetical protein
MLEIYVYHLLSRWFLVIHEGKRLLLIHRRRKKDNINVDTEETGCEDVDLLISPGTGSSDGFL